MRTTRPVPPGGTIAVVTPASAIGPTQIDANIDRLRAEGYVVRVMPHVYGRYVYMAGRDEERAADLMEAFLDPGIDAVFCSRGGYGCARLLPFLDLDAIAASDKPLLGFSDITILHAALNRRGLTSYHAPVLITDFDGKPEWMWDGILAALRGEPTLPADLPRAATVVPGVAAGRLVGGCLCLVTDLIGTPEEIDFAERIAFFEDVDEAPHRVDAMLTHLLATGGLDRVRGIVVGEMTGTDTPDKHDPTIGPWAWREIVRDRLGGLGVPLVTDFPAGHGPLRATLAFGAEVRLDADAGTLAYGSS